jgi:predicted ester cyclase
MTESRRIVLTRAMEVAVGIRDEDPGLYFTDDVSVWSPNLSASSLEDLKSALADREEAISNASLEVTGLDVVGDKAVAEWVLEADHSGPLEFDDVKVEPTGRRVRLAGATIAELRGNKVRAFRTYFDPIALVEQMTASG